MEISIRKEVMENFCEKLDGLLAMKVLRVRNYQGACTDGKTIYLPIEDTKKMARDMKEFLMMIKGLNYHELGHVLFTTFTSRQIKKFCTNNNIDLSEFFDILNMLEDMRIENYFVRVYPRSKAYLIYKDVMSIRRILKNVREHLFKYEWMSNIWIAVIGKVYLPKHFRMKLFQKTNTFDKETTAKIIDIIKRYINHARQYGSKLKYAKYRKQYEKDLLNIAKELYDIIHNANERVVLPPSPVGTYENMAKKNREDMDVDKILMVAQEDFDLDIEEGKNKDKIENVENSDGEEEEKGEEEEDIENVENSDGENIDVSGEGNGGIEKESEMENSNDEWEGQAGSKQASKDGNDEDTIKFVEDLKNEIKNMEKEAMDEVTADIQKDYEVIMDMDNEILTAEEEKARIEIEKILEKMVNEYKPHWVLRQKEGRVNLRYAMKGERNGDIRIFKKFKANKLNELSFRIFLNIDTSSSMSGEEIGMVRSMCKVILRAFEKTKSEVKVVGFNDTAKLYKDWEDKHIPLFKAWGGTVPATSLKLIVDEVRRLRKKYKQPFLHIILTDGEWCLVKEAERLIKELQRMGVITVEINIYVAHYHGSEYCYFINSVEELPKVIENLVKKISRQMIKRRQYL